MRLTKAITQRFLFYQANKRKYSLDDNDRADFTLFTVFGFTFPMNYKLADNLLMRPFELFFRKIKEALLKFTFIGFWRDGDLDRV
jgi:hypothetical protein